MARLPKCCGCSLSDFIGAICDIYPDGIPKNIINEKEKCEFFSQIRKKENYNDDIPIAKGR